MSASGEASSTCPRQGDRDRDGWGALPVPSGAHGEGNAWQKLSFDFELLCLDLASGDGMREISGQLCQGRRAYVDGVTLTSIRDSHPVLFSTF